MIRFQKIAAENFQKKIAKQEEKRNSSSQIESFHEGDLVWVQTPDKIRSEFPFIPLWGMRAGTTPIINLLTLKISYRIQQLKLHFPTQVDIWTGLGW